ncbi:S1 family peptidase [Plantactinospora endophytica]|uniref:AAA+ ATPase domain-containing protein n=1 Tax=Plantactinospora endophytica TaxID=673535 RepID=A0ABQ4E957_9ACTN|nr:serine protease [Plantactinospora endophytica]GIG91174.1 hypothetical protein Pen02_61100 [Plantactinospora endophytica]
MARDTEPRPGRVAGVFVHCPPETEYPYFGTGYQISDRLVLTAGHVFDKVPADCGPDGVSLLVELGGDGKSRRATCVWRGHDGVDLALLRLDEPPPEQVAPVRLGRVDRTRATTVSAVAMGFPKHAELRIRETGEGRRGRTQTLGRILTGADPARPGTLDFQLDATPAPAPTPDDSPWRGMSGAAVFTDESHLLVGVFREHLPDGGGSQHTVGALDAVTDQRWRDLLAAEDIQPDPRPVLPDGWNRGCPALTAYGDHADKLTAEKPFLTPGRLPFVDPGDHPSSPGRVLAALTRTAESADPQLGVMLAGIPGVGKTRLCLETAALAEREGWVVIHLGEPGHRASIEDAWRSVQVLSAPVLLVVEDLEWLADTTAETVRALRDGAHNVGARVAVLGPVRTAALRRTGGKLKPGGAFEVIEVRADPGYQAAIVRRAVRTAAGAAVDQTGEAHVLTICRGIPAIAVMLARYYNDAASEGLDISTAVPLGGDDVAGWLGKVLDREELRLPSVPEGEPSPKPDGRLTAAAWIAAATPQSVGTLESALEKRGKILSPLGNPWQPSRLLDSLCRAGILSRSDDTIRTVHDLYADHLLTRVLVEPDSGTDDHGSGAIRVKVLRRTLKPGLDDQRVLRNVAVALQRLRESLGEPTGLALDSAVAQWCVDKAEKLTALLDGDPDGQTLDTLLRLPSWRPGIRRLVEPIAESWLRRHFRDPKSRDGVLATASCLDPQVGYPYVMGWLSHNLSNPRAAFAFHRLSPPEGLDAAYDEWTVERAFWWLAQNAPHPNASFVLRDLLDHSRRLGLPPGHPHAARVVAWALGWLRRNGSHRNASYVAPPLVQRPELTGADLEATALFLLDRIAPREPYNASFALEAVLARQRQRRDLPDAVVRKAVKESLRWLRDPRGYGLRPEAAYVLENLIIPDRRSRDSFVDAVGLALNWLRKNPGVKETGRVLDRMLHLARRETDKWARLSEDESADLATLTLSWLFGPQTTRIARVSVLGALLKTRLIDDDADSLRRCADEALALYRETPSPTVARDLLPALLAKTSRLADLRADLLALTFAHVARHPRDPHTSYPMTSLLSRHDLTPEEYATALAATLEWLGAHPSDESAVKLLTAALRNPRASREDRGKLVDRTVQMLSRLLPLGDSGRRLVDVLLTQRAETTPEWNRFVGRACGELAVDGMPVRAGWVLPILLRGVDVLDGPVRDELHSTCVEWCAGNPGSGRTAELLARVLTDRTLPPEVRRRASVVACARLGPGTSRVSGAGRLLAAVLRDGNPGDPAEADRILAVGLDWLEVWVDDGTAAELLPQVAHRLRRDAGAGRATGEDVRRATGYLDAWLDRHPAAPTELRAGIQAHRDALARLALG